MPSVWEILGNAVYFHLKLKERLLLQWNLQPFKIQVGIFRRHERKLGQGCVINSQQHVLLLPNFPPSRSKLALWTSFYQRMFFSSLQNGWQVRLKFNKEGFCWYTPVVFFSSQTHLANTVWSYSTPVQFSQTPEVQYRFPTFKDCIQTSLTHFKGFWCHHLWRQHPCYIPVIHQVYI